MRSSAAASSHKVLTKAIRMSDLHFLEGFVGQCRRKIPVVPLVAVLHERYALAKDCVSNDGSRAGLVRKAFGEHFQQRATVMPIHCQSVPAKRLESSSKGCHVQDSVRSPHRLHAVQIDDGDE